MEQKRPPNGVLPDSASNETPDLASLGDALVQSLMDEQFKKGNIAFVPQKVLSEDHSSPLPSLSMNAYTGTVDDFTKNATALIEQLPLITKARVAYEKAMRANAEMRRVLDADEQNLRTLMTQLEQGLSAHSAKPAPDADKKKPEPARVDRMIGTDPARRAVRWP